MKKFMIVALVLITLGGIQAQNRKNPARNTETVVFTVNMTCNNCIKKITRQLTLEQGVKDLHLNLENQVVAVKFLPSRTGKAHLKQTIENLNYVVVERENREGLPDDWQ